MRILLVDNECVFEELKRIAGMRNQGTTLYIEGIEGIDSSSRQ